MSDIFQITENGRFILLKMNSLNRQNWRFDTIYRPTLIILEPFCLEPKHLKRTVRAFYRIVQMIICSYSETYDSYSINKISESIRTNKKAFGNKVFCVDNSTLYWMSEYDMNNLKNDVWRLPYNENDYGYGDDDDI